MQDPSKVSLAGVESTCSSRGHQAGLECQEKGQATAIDGLGGH